MSRPWHRAALRCSAVVLTVAVVVPVTSGIGAVRHTNTVSPRLVGKWTRTITDADVKRAKGSLLLLAGNVVKFNVAKNGHFTLDEGFGPNLGHEAGNIVPAGPNRIHINISGEPANLYRWRVSGRLLTLTKLKDPNPNRVAVFWGVWKRK